MTGEHVAAATTTQAKYPTRTAVRTGVQTFLGAALGLLVLVPAIINVFLETVGTHLPGEVYAWLAGAAVVVTAVSTAIARVQAMPGVIAWTARYLPWLAPDPRVPGK
jgi:hypothetical protein